MWTEAAGDRASADAVRGAQSYSRGLGLLWNLAAEAQAQPAPWLWEVSEKVVPLLFLHLHWAVSCFSSD